ncbi:MAG TPA: FHA domain-containing protein [Herpetosiphonaceae bacterium]
MLDKGTLEQESNDLKREIGNLETQIKSVRDYIAAQERNLRSAAESVRAITERSLAEARGDLYLKELRLQQVRQEFQIKQEHLAKIGAIARKQQDIQTLELERDRITGMLQRAQVELQQLMHEYQSSSSPSATAEYALIFSGGERFVLPASASEMLVGCADTGVFPDIDLAPLGGTAQGVSRRHAALRHSNGAWSIVDLNSTNGTYVNTIKIAPNMPTPLQDQTRLRFGNLDAVFGQQPAPAHKTVRLT